MSRLARETFKEWCEKQYEMYGYYPDVDFETWMAQSIQVEKLMEQKRAKEIAELKIPKFGQREW